MVDRGMDQSSGETEGFFLLKAEGNVEGKEDMSSDY